TLARCELVFHLAGSHVQASREHLCPKLCEKFVGGDVAGMEKHVRLIGGVVEVGGACLLPGLVPLVAAVEELYADERLAIARKDPLLGRCRTYPLRQESF
ncbi:MAG: hypothetical protein ACI8XO_002295, partial [Verrucomicrobiales bacterium]